MRNMKVIVIIGVGVILTMAGCLTVPRHYYRNAKYIEEEYAPYGLTGTASISGQAFMKTIGGDVKYGAGETVYLLPKTSYSEEIYTRCYIWGQHLQPALDPRHPSYVKTTTSDGEGRFVFKNLPAGGYFIGCDVFWQVATGYKGALQRTGGVAIAEVYVNEGEDIEVVATKPGRVFGSLDKTEDDSKESDGAVGSGVGGGIGKGIKE